MSFDIKSHLQAAAQLLELVHKRVEKLKTLSMFFIFFKASRLALGPLPSCPVGIVGAVLPVDKLVGLGREPDPSLRLMPSLRMHGAMSIYL
jgi:hypothetical protein